MTIHSRSRSSRQTGFSLVEVTLALGIVGFALIVIVMLVGSLLQNAGRVSNDHHVAQIISSVDSHLQSESFDNVYGWLQDPTSAPALYAFTCRLTPDAQREPVPAATGRPGVDYLVEPVVMDGADSTFNSYLAAREGDFFRVVMAVSETNPVGETKLPTTTADYSEAWISATVDLHIVEATGVPLTDDNLEMQFETAVTR